MLYQLIKTNINSPETFLSSSLNTPWWMFLELLIIKCLNFLSCFTSSAVSDGILQFLSLPAQNADNCTYSQNALRSVVERQFLRPGYLGFLSPLCGRTSPVSQNIPTSIKIFISFILSRIWDTKYSHSFFMLPTLNLYGNIQPSAARTVPYVSNHVELL